GEWSLLRPPAGREPSGTSAVGSQGARATRARAKVDNAAPATDTVAAPRTDGGADDARCPRACSYPDPEAAARRAIDRSPRVSPLCDLARPLRAGRLCGGAHDHRRGAGAGGGRAKPAAWRDAANQHALPGSEQTPHL